MHKTITAAAAASLLAATATMHSASQAQYVSEHAAPENCRWSMAGARFTLYCRSDPDPIDPAEAERDAELANIGLRRVRPPEWSATGVPMGFDETTVDRANQGDIAAIRMVGIFHLAYGNRASAISWLEKAGKAGDREAALRLGTLHDWGLAVPLDHGKARDWFVIAANAGDQRAMHWLGELYLSGGRNLAKNPVEAARWFRPAAEAGDAAAMYRLAELSNDAAEARGWLERAARAGFTAAAANLKQHGLPVPAVTPVPELAVPAGPLPECTAPATIRRGPLASLGSEPDDERTIAIAAGGMAGDKAAALCYSRRAALRGSGYAASDLAEAYYSEQAGPPGSFWIPMILPDQVFAVAKDDAEALRWFALAARNKEQFIPGAAMTKIGDFYATGLVVPRDDVEAARWYAQAVALEDFGAPMALARMYHGGFGVVRDDVQAMRLLLGNIGLANDRAVYGAMIANGMPSLDARWTADAIGLAAEGGYVEAMIDFGLRLARGDGFAKDLPGARHCLSLAAALGEPRAAAELAKLPGPRPGERSPERDFMSTPVPRCRA